MPHSNLCFLVYCSLTHAAVGCTELRQKISPDILLFVSQFSLELKSLQMEAGAIIQKMFNWKCMRKKRRAGKNVATCRSLIKKVMVKMTVSDAIKCDKSYIEHIIIQLHNIHLVMEMKCNWMCTGLILSCFMSLFANKIKVYNLWDTSSIHAHIYPFHILP